METRKSLETKECILKTAKKGFEHLLEKEYGWYEYVASLGFDRIPEIYSKNPFIIEKIEGYHSWKFFEVPFFTYKDILKEIFKQLDILHSLGRRDSNVVDTDKMYRKKVFNRLYMANLKMVDIEEPSQADYFCPIHGDPTFSNILIKEKKAYFIDPRGYFGDTLIYGDSYYDWAKLYYSVVGNYDQFIQGKFEIVGEEVRIDSNGFEHLEWMFDEKFSKKEMKKIRLIHALIWLSLTGYVKDDERMVLGAYLNGKRLLEEISF